MPLRTYACDAGHEFEAVEPMTADARQRCDRMVATPEGDPSACNAPCRRVIVQTQRPIVRGGTPTHHKQPS